MYWRKNTDYVPYLEYPMLKDTGIVRHGFSTRLGGVSEGYYASMNLSFDRGDRKEAVAENFRRIGEATRCPLRGYGPLQADAYNECADRDRC